MHLALLGASRGVSYHALLTALADPSIERISLLLRKPDVFDNDEVVSAAVKEGRVRIVQGDATNEDDLAKLLTGVDVVVTSIGGQPQFTLRGIVLDQPGICTRAAYALLRVLKRSDKPPRVVVISSMGIGENHAVMPLPLRILYPWLLHTPHLDKEGLEYLVQRASIALPTPATAPAVVAESNATDAPESFLPEVVIVRPAMFTDGTGGHEVKAAEDAYTYYISRADVGRFVAQRCLRGEEWVNKAPVVGY